MRCVRFFFNLFRFYVFLSDRLLRGCLYGIFFVEKSVNIYEPNKDANEKKSKSRKNLVKVPNSNDMATIIEEDM